MQQVSVQRQMRSEEARRKTLTVLLTPVTESPTLVKLLSRLQSSQSRFRWYVPRARDHKGSIAASTSAVASSSSRRRRGK